MDVVIDEPVAILEVLAFGNAVGGNQQIQLTFPGHLRGPLFGSRREGGKDGAEIPAKTGQGRLVPAGAGDQCRLYAERFLRPSGKLSVKVLGCIGECGKYDDLAVAGVDRAAALGLDHLAQSGELGVTRGVDLLGGCVELCKPVVVCPQILLPVDLIDILQQDFDLAADEQAFECGIVEIHVLDFDLFHFFGALFDACQQRIYVVQLAFYGEGERRDGAFHALQHVHPKQVNQTLFAVHLPEEPLTAAKASAVLGIVGGLLVGQYVTQGSVCRQAQAADFEVDVFDGLELAGAVYVRLDVDRLEPRWELASLLGAVILLDVLPAASDGKQIEQAEVVEPQHLNQQRRGSLLLVEVKPPVELLLREAGRAVDAEDSLICKRRVIPFSGERDLVSQVCQAVVYRGCREHQDARFDAFFDDLPHQPVVTGLVVLTRCFLVAKVVGLVDDHQVVVAPVHVGEVDIAGVAAVAGEVRVVQDVVVEAVGGKDIPAVIGFIERPVVAQALGHQHQHSVVAELVVFDDGKRLERLAEADAIGDDATAKAFELFNCSNHAVTLKLEELPPDVGVSNSGCGLDDALFVQFVSAAAEQVKQDPVVHGRWRSKRADGFQFCNEPLLCFG